MTFQQTERRIEILPVVVGIGTISLGSKNKKKKEKNFIVCHYRVNTLGCMLWVSSSRYLLHIWHSIHHNYKKNNEIKLISRLVTEHT